MVLASREFVGLRGPSSRKNAADVQPLSLEHAVGIKRGRLLEWICNFFLFSSAVSVIAQSVVQRFTTVMLC